MIGIKSRLELLRLKTLQSSMFTIFPEDGTVDCNPDFEKYEVDINFDLETASETPNIFRVLYHVEINEQERPGYYLSGAFEGVFCIEGEITDKVKGDFALQSCIPMLGNFARTHLQEITMRGEFGEYTLPFFDMHKMYKKKRELVEKMEEEQ